MSNVLSDSQASSEGAAGKLKTRLASAATVPIIQESAREVAVPVPQRSATRQGDADKENVGDVAKDGVWRKTTEDKKKLLGTMLGNVDALIEGVRKAGVWGLA